MKSFSTTVEITRLISNTDATQIY